MDNFLKNLKKLCLTPGISGNEHYSGITDKIFDIVKNIDKNARIDEFGNVICVLGAGYRKILLDAHLDEVGFLVSKKNSGKIKLVAIGDINFQKVNGLQAYVVEKNIPGLILQDTSDIVFEPHDKKSHDQIKTGDLISFARTFSCKNNCIKATSLDNRIGCACLIDLMEKIKNNDDYKNLQIFFTFTAGEERDKSILDKIAIENNIDFGVIIDAAYAKPVNFGTDNMSIPETGKGCAIQYLGANFVVNKEIISLVEKIAFKEGIFFQKEIPLPELGRTNFSKLQQAGKPGCVINIPVKNQHEQFSEADIADFYSARNLILSIIKSFGNKLL